MRASRYRIMRHTYDGWGLVRNVYGAQWHCLAFYPSRQKARTARDTFKSQDDLIAGRMKELAP